MRITWRMAILGVLLSASATPCVADEADELRKLRDSTISLVNALVDQGVLTRAKADQIIAQAQAAGAKSGAVTPPAATVTPSVPPPAAGAAPGSGVVRVPYVPEAVKEEIRDEVKKDVLAQAKTERWGAPGAFPDWLNHFMWYGDFRLREEFDRFPSANEPNAPVQVLQAYGVNIANSTDANNRMRVRARFGFDASVGDTVTVGMRLATGGVGAGGNPATENQTLGNYETRSTVGFDRAFIAYRPESWLSFSGGRLGMPFYNPTTLIWANDVSLEGVAVRIDPQFGPHWTVYTTAGAFPILQNDPSPTSDAKSKWLYAAQAGFEWRISRMAGWRLGAALYDYRHIEGIPNPNSVSVQYNGTAAPFRQTGNTVFDIDYQLNQQNGTQNPLYGLASKFHEANLSTTVDIGLFGTTRVVLDADWVRNLGFNQAEIFRRTGFEVDRQTTGWQTRLLVGDPVLSRKFSWQAWLGYRYVERDATVDAFTDADFHLGGTDAKGYFVGGRFAFERNTSIGVRYFNAKQIDGVELAGADAALGGLPLAIDVLQLDIQSSF